MSNTILKFEDFADHIAERIGSFYGQDAEVSIKRIQKNNGVKRTGIIIREGKVNLTPTIYLEDFYAMYEGGASEEKIVQRIIETYEKTRSSTNFDIDFFQNYKKMSKSLAMRLVNYEANKELLKEVPHRQYLDMAIIYTCVVSSEVFGDASIIIKNDHMKAWKVDEQTLYEAAVDNVSRIHRPVLKRIRNLLEQVDIRIPANTGEPELYVLTNDNYVYGAAAMLYPGLMNTVSNDLGERLFVIPSSVHELLIVADDGCVSQEELKAMIGEVNSTALQPEEVLSDNLYIYDRRSDTVEIA